jgi:hypothetical protein
VRKKKMESERGRLLGKKLKNKRRERENSEGDGDFSKIQTTVRERE